MKHAVLTFTLALSNAVAFAQAAQDDHSSHHPPAGAASAASAAAPAQPAADAFTQQMEKMQAMRKRMQAARTPAERQALLDEHMKLMHSGMDLMSRMGDAQGMGMGMGGGMASAARPNGPMGSGGMGGMMDHHAAMERRMAMMEQMMQMMVDREAAMPRK